LIRPLNCRPFDKLGWNKESLLKIAVLSLALLMVTGCSSSKQQTAPKPAVKQYPLTGKIVSIDSSAHTAKVDAAAIPNFMDAMTMDYPIVSNSDLALLKVGESIRATVNVSDDGTYNLSDIHQAGK
jgi:hypothetical protein